MRPFYLRVHPDLVLNNSVAKKENLESMQNLENALMQPVNRKVELQFHVLDKRNKTTIEQKIYTMIQPSVDDETWIYNVDKALFHLLKNIFTKEQLPKLAIPRRKVESRAPQRQPDHTDQYQQFHNHKSINYQLRQSYAWAGPLDGNDKFSPQVVIKQLFQDNRVTCSQEVPDPHQAIQVFVDTMHELPNSCLARMVSPIADDILFYIDHNAEHTKLDGRVFTIPFYQEPKHLADDIKRLIQYFDAAKDTTYH